MVVVAVTFKPMLAWLPPGLPRVSEVVLDIRVLLFSFGISLLAGILVGVLPAFRTSRASLEMALKKGGRFVTGDVRRRRVHGLLVVGEVAIAFVLLTGAGLLVKSFVRLSTAERGFDPADVLALDIALPWERYRDDALRETLLQSIEDRVAVLPGVRSDRPL